ncbi:MFS transporter, putative [Talaromyces stipitatus ATCC 10500]|uniref:MFS transporter, putative n=1 Tax=Talaromyces stipitatus (strain ATCC 10500 / CBS 375.48 / QM 6759 / NRRL 1006) TaxID=441959 RepID=B8MIF3_TALSN|nr:MFS transporter, putative [Talaromyces stipitatus ATCC 10500]EED14637.1 MFS transporter, putative [Talaromyces stipitatus ATCC 10500]
MDEERTSLDKQQQEFIETEEAGPAKPVFNDEIFMPPALAALSEEEYERVKKSAVRKLDLRIMPAVVLMYILNYLDRQNIASAKLAHLVEDLNMTSVQYQTAVSLLFVGYITMQVPSNMIASKIKYPGIYINVAMAIWGAISACTAAVHSFSGLVAARFFLGVVEAAFLPGVVYYISLFYNRQQMTLRTAIFYSGSQVGNAVGPLIAIGVLNLDGKQGISGWRWLFIIEGVVTIFFAIVFALILPSSLQAIRGFSKLESEFLLYNYAKDIGQQDHKDEASAWKGVKLAVMDPKTWLLLATLWATYVSAAVVNWFPSVVATLGYSRNTTYGLTAPPYILSCIVISLVGWHSDKKQERFLHVAIPLAVAVIANIIAVASLNTGARYFAMMLMPGSCYSAAIVILSWVTGTLSQPAVKRASAIALINAVCNTPNIWTSYIYYGAPRYLAAFLLNMAMAALAIVFAFALHIYLRRENAKLDRGEDSGKNGPTAAQQAAGFRYLI